MSEAKILEKLVSRFDELVDRFDQIDNVLAEQDIKLFNINKTLKKHSDQFDELNYTINKIHDQTARLSLEQGKLAMKIDQLKNSSTEKNDKKINSI
jgi:chromosome segregation ATPase